MWLVRTGEEVPCVGGDTGAEVPCVGGEDWRRDALCGW